MKQARSRRRPPTRASTPAGGQANGADRLAMQLERVCVIMLVALLVATPLVPSESVATTGSSVVLITLWLLLAAAWCLRCLQQPAAVVFRAGISVWLLLALIGWHTISCLVMARAGAMRPTVNMLWQWIAYLLIFLLVRQIVRSPRGVRALLACMIGLSVALSAFGVYHTHVIRPPLRAKFDVDPEGTLRDAGIITDRNSPQARHFADRLASTEPIATFALTNSLAGFLMPWTIIVICAAVWMLWSMLSRPPGELRLSGMVAAHIAVLLLGLLLLTKSRTAFLALLAGLVAAAILSGLGRARFRRWQSIAAALLLVGTSLLLLMATQVDARLIAEAPKSFLYRLEYWQSTLQMIRDYPWFGCGDGNFQLFYTAYKLPQASETVADPHNFLFEVWATAGTPALVLLLAWLISLAWQSRQVSSGDPVTADSGTAASGSGHVADAAMDDPDPGSAGNHAVEPRWYYVGAAVGMLIGMPISWIVALPMDGAVLLLGMPALLLVLAGLHPWVERGRLSAWWLLAALAALLLNLSAAGGIGFPAVGQNVWLLAALMLNLTTNAAPYRVPRGGAIAGLVVLAILALLQFRTMYQPVLRGGTLVDEAQRATQAGNWQQAQQRLQLASEADPYHSQPWIHLAHLYLRQWVATGSEATYDEFQRAIEESLSRERHSAQLHRQIGDWYLTALQQRNRPSAGAEAVAAYRRAVTLYPASAILHAQLAWCLHRTGQHEAAREAAARALELDAQHPHDENKLKFEALFNGQLEPGHPPSPPIEPTLHQLRAN